jgi:uncharacterized repeat protein (TIGR03847 family)
MPRFEIELAPVDHVTTDAIGPKGNRVFYLQGTQGDQVVTLVAEKFQIQALAIGAEQFLDEITERFPELPKPSAEYNEGIMQIIPPVEPLFRIADVGLGYNAENDWVVLIIHQLMPENTELVEENNPDQEAGVVRFSCTRDQLQALGRWGAEVTQRGRKICTQCGQPEEPEGHFCVKKNGGHKHN